MPGVDVGDMVTPDDVALDKRYIVEVIWGKDKDTRYVACKDTAMLNILLDDLKTWVPERVTIFMESAVMERSKNKLTLREDDITDVPDRPLPRATVNADGEVVLVD